jgi:hypothetical protein
MEPMDSANRPAPPAPPPLWDARAVMKIWFDVWTQAAESYLRSAAFLRLMQQGFGTQDSDSERKVGR